MGTCFCCWADAAFDCCCGGGCTAFWFWIDCLPVLFAMVAVGFLAAAIVVVFMPPFDFLKIDWLPPPPVLFIETLEPARCCDVDEAVVVFFCWSCWGWRRRPPGFNLFSLGSSLKLQCFMDWILFYLTSKLRISIGLYSWPS